MKCKQRLYLTAGRDAVVAEGHEDAHSLYAVPGDEIPQSAVDKFDLVDGHLKDAKAEADAAKTKEAAAPKDKEQKAGDDKAESGTGAAAATSGGAGA